MVMLRRTIKPEIAMSFAPEAEPLAETLAKPEALLRVPVGLASPLWGLFAGAAMTGATWWWMTRWTRPQNLEAMFGAAAEAEAIVEPEITVPVARVAEAIEAVVEAAAEPVLEAMAEATPEPMTEALVEATPDPIVEALVEDPTVLEAVGGESAPISPVLEALAPETAEPAPAPKPKKKPAPAPSAD
jgi:hypothetical protein